MTEQELEKLVRELPMSQQEPARAKIAQAVRFGWTNIHLSDWGKRADQADLFGTSPAGEADFLPDVDDEAAEREVEDGG